MKLVPNPVVGIPLAFLSHIVLDLTPHNDFDIKPGMTMREILSPKFQGRNFFLVIFIIDIILTIISFIYLFITKHHMLLLLGGIVAILPDAIEQGLLPLGIKLPGWQDKLQWRVSKKYGFISYPVISLIALYILIYH